MKNLFSSIILVSTFFVYTSAGCSLAGKSLSKFDKTEYIFIGKVVGYTEALRLPGSRMQTVGLIVEVTERINLPKTPEAHFEVFPYNLGADCSILGTDKNELEEEFPDGAEVRVIAKEAKLLPSVLTDGDIRLEVRPEEPSGIARNFYENGERMTSANSIFNYETFRAPTPADYTEDFMPFLDAKVFLPDFELRKDLLRLEKSKTQPEKSQILQRLLYLPIQSAASVPELLKRYAANKNEFDDLYYKRLFEIEGLSDEDYKVIKKTVPLKYRKKYKNNV